MRRVRRAFDYVVVGGGTSGCLLANRLARDRATSVLLLEAGGSDKKAVIRIPVGYLACIGNPVTDCMDPMLHCASACGLTDSAATQTATVCSQRLGCTGANSRSARACACLARPH